MIMMADGKASQPEEAISIGIIDLLPTVSVFLTFFCSSFQVAVAHVQKRGFIFLRKIKQIFENILNSKLCAFLF